MASEQNQANHDDHGQNHILPLSVYFGVFSSLMVLTVLTVAVSYWDLGAFSLPVAMLVAVIKAGLVVGFFMHLKYENRFLTLVFVYALFFVGLFFGITMMDITTRGTLNPEEGNFVFKQERNAKKLALIKPAWRPTHAVHGDKKHADKHEQQIAHKSKGVTVIAAGLGHGQAAAPAKRAASGVSAAVLAKGKKKFETLCASCHSKDGSASGVVAKSLKPSPPNFKAGQFRYGGTFESTFKIITDGSPKSPLMTAWKAIIPKAEREAIAHYILSLNEKKVAPAKKVAPVKRAAPAKRAAAGVSAAVLAKGKKKFETLCASCHSKDGSASGVVAKSLKPSPPNFKAGQFRYGGTFESTFKIITDGSPKSPLMTAWKAIIPKAEREAIAHYILSLHKK